HGKLRPVLPIPFPRLTAQTALRCHHVVAAERDGHLPVGVVREPDRRAPARRMVAARHFVPTRAVPFPLVTREGLSPSEQDDALSTPIARQAVPRSSRRSRSVGGKHEPGPGRTVPHPGLAVARRTSE